MVEGVEELGSKLNAAFLLILLIPVEMHALFAARARLSRIRNCPSSFTGPYLLLFAPCAYCTVHIGPAATGAISLNPNSTRSRCV